jgi:hypothetical protein
MRRYAIALLASALLSLGLPGPASAQVDLCPPPSDLGCHTAYAICATHTISCEVCRDVRDTCLKCDAEAGCDAEGTTCGQLGYVCGFHYPAKTCSKMVEACEAGFDPPVI